MKRLLAVNALCVALLLSGFVLAQSSPPKAADPPAKPPAAATPTAQPAQPTVYKLTELQKARLDVARQKILRWQDRMNEALADFSAECEQAQQENKWPEVRCNLQDLSVTATQPMSGQMPAPAAAATPSPPEVKK